MTTSAVKPRLEDLLGKLRDNIFATLNCVRIGKIQSFDASKKTVDVTLVDKCISQDGVVSEMPLLTKCPVFTLQGGGGALKMPIAVGDTCVVLFSDRNIDVWHTKGIESLPNDGRCHSFSDGIAIVGLNYMDDSSISAYPSSELELSYANAKMTLKGGKANIQNATTSLLQVLTDLTTGILGLTVAGVPVVDTTTKINTAVTELNALFYKD